MNIDFTALIPGSEHFTWHEALYLHKWDTHHYPTDDEANNIIIQAQRLDKVRDFLGAPIIVSCWIRPNSANTPDAPQYQGADYNALVKGAHDSSHIPGMATDYTVEGKSVDEVMQLIVPNLNQFQLAAENNGSVNGRNWIHNQSRPMPTGLPWRVFNP